MSRLAAAAVLVLMVLVSWTAAGSGSEVLAAGPPTELWDAFPLDPAVTEQPAPGAGSAPPPADAGTDEPLLSPAPGPEGSSVPWAMILLAVALGVAALGGVWLVRRTRETTASARSRPIDPTLMPTVRRGPLSARGEDERPPPQTAKLPAEPPAPPVAQAPSDLTPLAPLEEDPEGGSPHGPAAVPRETAEALIASRRELARLAADYLDLVSAGSARPVLELAERRGWSAGRARARLGRARELGILVGAGKGRAGGTLSEEGRALLADPPPRSLRLAHSRDSPRPTRGPDPTRREAG